MALNKFLKEPKRNEPLSKLSEKDRPFSPINFYMMGGCVILIILGFLFMSGGGSTTPEGYNPEIFSTRRIVVGPLLAFIGFLLMAFAIIWDPDKKDFNFKGKSKEKE